MSSGPSRERLGGFIGFESGRAGLKQAGRAERKPRLSTADLKKNEGGLKRGPRSPGVDMCLWTARHVAQLIGEACGVTYHAGHVWRILRHLGWICRRPTGRALEPDEEAIRQWRKKRWPEIKNSPKRGSKHSVGGRKGAERATESVSRWWQRSLEPTGCGGWAVRPTRPAAVRKHDPSSASGIR